MELVEIKMIRFEQTERLFKLSARVVPGAPVGLAGEKAVFTIGSESRSEALLSIAVAWRHVKVVDAAIDSFGNNVGGFTGGFVHDDDAAEADEGKLFACLPKFAARNGCGRRGWSHCVEMSGGGNGCRGNRSLSNKNASFHVILRRAGLRDAAERTGAVCVQDLCEKSLRLHGNPIAVIFPADIPRGVFAAWRRRADVLCSTHTRCRESILPETEERIGVLSIQGDYEAHAAAFAACGAETMLVRTPQELATVTALALPGGESTTMLRMLRRDGFDAVLRDFVRTHPVFATCAGCILLAREVRNPQQESFAALDIAIERNAYGRQNESAIVPVETSVPGGPDRADGPMEGVFIRAPRIVATGPEVATLATRDGFPVLVRQGRILAATFHPELSEDRRVHRLFLEMLAGKPPESSFGEPSLP